MSAPDRHALEFRQCSRRDCIGLKGPRAAEWLASRGVAVPAAPNQWARWAAAGPAAAPGAATSGATANAEGRSGAIRREEADAATMEMAAGEDGLVARLGTFEFFLEDGAGGGTVRGLEAALETPLPGVYPVLREDAAFSLSGPGSYEVLAQVCNVNFADLELASRPVIMTLMIGVAVLVAPQRVGERPRFRIWCDPTFGAYLEESLGPVVTESGGNHRRQT